MTDALDLEVAKRQLAKDILRDLGIENALSKNLSNLPAQAESLIDEYVKLYKRLYKHINAPLQ